MQNQPRNRTEYDFIRQAVSDAMQPFVERLTKVETRVEQSDARFYTREMTDSKFDEIKTAISELRTAIQSRNDNFWKLVGGASAIVAGIIMLAQHVSIH